MMSPTPKKFKRPDQKPLPKPNVEFATASDSGDMTPEKVRGMIANPIYAGVGPYPAIIDEAEWIRNAAKMIRSEGAEQYLVNMLYVLRKSLATTASEAEND
jgi:hypothetical protein